MEKRANSAKIEKEIRTFFNNITPESDPRRIKQIKNLAMHNKLKLKALRKKFCKSCFSPKLKVKSIKKGIKTVECEICNKKMRWKLRTS